jgi:phospholipid-binding lipoprotein MlaA
MRRKGLTTRRGSVAVASDEFGGLRSMEEETAVMAPASNGAQGGETVMNHSTWNVTRMRPILLAGALMMALGCTRPPGVPGPDGSVHGAPLVEADVYDAPDYDPWQPFNEAMFTFNHDVLDRWLVKPAATGWEKVVPMPARKSFARAIDNLDMPRRLVNNVLQLRPVGAGREVARFVLNTTVGVAGLFDVAALVDLEPSDADTGQTLALYGVSAGPYLVLPTMAPSTLRDAIGHTADGMLDPIGYFMPFIANQAKSIVVAVNERSLNLKLFADVEESVLDLYSAARNGYLQRRRSKVYRAYADREAQWRWAFRDSTPAEHPTATATAPVEPPAAAASAPVENPTAAAVEPADSPAAPAVEPAAPSDATTVASVENPS